MVTDKDVTDSDTISGDTIEQPTLSGEGGSPPPVQQKLSDNLIQIFGNKLIPAPAHAWTAYGLTFEIAPTELEPGSTLDIFRALRDKPQFHFDMLVDNTAVDWLDKKEPRFEVIYHLLSTKHYHRLCVKVRLSEENPEVDSVRPLWASANFMERETFDMFGILFRGHGDLRRILMYDEFVGHPLRKDYPVRGKQPRVPLRVPELRNTSADMHRQQLVSLPVRQRMPQLPEGSGKNNGKAE